MIDKDIEGRKLDPHVHSHCLVMNATQAVNEECYSYLNDAIFSNQKLLGMMYQHNLGAKVEKLGALIKANEQLLEAHQQAVENTLQLLEGIRHDDEPKEYQG